MYRAVSFWSRALVGLVLVFVTCLPAIAQEEEAPSLYERLGGLMPISVVVSDLLDAVVADEELNKNPKIDEARQQVPKAYLKYHVTAMVCQATGGGCEYSGRDMQASHAHLDITEANWNRFMTIVKSVLDKHEVPEAEQGELMAIVESTKAAIVMSGSR